MDTDRLTVGSVLSNEVSVEAWIYDDFSVVHPHQLDTRRQKSEKPVSHFVKCSHKRCNHFIQCIFI